MTWLSLQACCHRHDCPLLFGGLSPTLPGFPGSENLLPLLGIILDPSLPLTPTANQVPLVLLLK